jgi:hypothetical protein
MCTAVSAHSRCKYPVLNCWRIDADSMLHRGQAADWHIKCLNCAGGGGRAPFWRLRTHRHILTHALGISGASAQERE